MIVYDHGEVKEWSMFHAHDLNTLRACIFGARKIYQLCHRIVYLKILFLSLDLTTYTRNTIIIADWKKVFISIILMKQTLKRIINLIISHASENMGDWICLGITNFFSYVILDHTSRHLWADNLVGSVITPFLHRFKCPQVFPSIKYV